MATQDPPAGTRRATLHHEPEGPALLHLTTTGAKSGKRRTVPVRPFPDGEDAWLVVGSAGGAPRHPSWFVNLLRNPEDAEVEWRGRTVGVAPRVLEGEERATAWERIVRERPTFAEYAERTGRELPVVRLTAR